MARRRYWHPATRCGAWRRIAPLRPNEVCGSIGPIG